MRADTNLTITRTDQPDSMPMVEIGPVTREKAWAHFGRRLDDVMGNGPFRVIFEPATLEDGDEYRLTVVTKQDDETGEDTEFETYSVVFETGTEDTDDEPTGAETPFVTVTATDNDQIRTYGQVMFGHGPWPGDPFDNARAAEAERRRGREAPVIPQLTSAKPLSS